MSKVSQEALVTMKVLTAQGQSNSEIARTLGVSEGTVRYRLKQRTTNGPDGRANKPSHAQAVSAVIADWMNCYGPNRGDSTSRPVNIRELYEFLVMEHNYSGSYKSVVRYVRKRYPVPKHRTYRRVETPAGVQAQVDWLDLSDVDIGGGSQRLYGLVMVLSHSRKEAVIWCQKMETGCWLWAHTQAFHRLKGIPAVVRIDNLKTGIINGGGPWGKINQTYRRYSRLAGFHIDACLPYSPEDKGKVERRISAIRSVLWPRRSFTTLAEFQQWTDERLDKRAHQRRCPATGESVYQTWQEEVLLLQSSDSLPEVFDNLAHRRVGKDATVQFENHTYSVPFSLFGQQVEVQGCGMTVQIWFDGKRVASHPRHTPHLVVIDETHYQGKATDTVLPPPPLGKMAKRIKELAQQSVHSRSMDFYQQLSEVAR
jgi:transposase